VDSYHSLTGSIVTLSCYRCLYSRSVHWRSSLGPTKSPAQWQFAEGAVWSNACGM